MSGVRPPTACESPGQGISACTALTVANSEASAAHQKDLFFNEAELEGASAQPAAAETEDGKIAVPAHQRTKRGRKPLDPALLVGRNVGVQGFYLGRLMQRQPELVREAVATTTETG